MDAAKPMTEPVVVSPAMREELVYLLLAYAKVLSARFPRAWDLSQIDDQDPVAASDLSAAQKLAYFLEIEPERCSRYD